MKKPSNKPNGLRASILAVLGEGAKTRQELAEQLGRPAGNVGVALAELKHAGKVSSEKVEGNAHRYRLHGPAVSPIKEGPVDEPVAPKKARKPRKAQPALPRLTVVGTPRQVLEERKRELEFARDLALARLEEVALAIEALS